MSERSRWFPVVAILGLIGAGVPAPALAWDGGPRFGTAGFPPGFAMHTARPLVRNNVLSPRIPARHANVQNDLRFHRRALQNGAPITIWPYSSFTDTTPTYVPPTQSQVVSSPPVIVMSGLPNSGPDRAVPETPPDLSYVAGCHAIPNGYHCDGPRTAAVAPCQATS